MSKNKKKQVDKPEVENKVSEEIKEETVEAESGGLTEEPQEEETVEAEAETETEAETGNEWKDRYTRQLAEFDNFRKRSEKEKSQMFDMGAKVIAEKILPTIDNFERGLKDAPDGAFSEGMEMVYKQLLKNLEDAGVKAIECVGKQFDPNIHNAVMHEEDDSGEENIVTEELQKGYMYKDSLLRPSMVKVKN